MKVILNKVEWCSITLLFFREDPVMNLVCKLTYVYCTPCLKDLLKTIENYETIEKLVYNCLLTVQPEQTPHQVFRIVINFPTTLILVVGNKYEISK